ncbi:hypothetical protein GCM10009745_37640 [Kribbella yunnanensis]|uniref:Uncharacterized protein n=1 Tax=Kribbella yunnanensis TaxID=190194 RepID=A0ABP4TKY0_9ACTN
MVLLAGGRPPEVCENVRALPYECGLLRVLLSERFHGEPRRPDDDLATYVLDKAPRGQFVDVLLCWVLYVVLQEL